MRCHAGVIAASGTLGILIPPSIMLIIMADLMAISVGNVFMAAVVPGLTLAAFYLIFVAGLSAVKPSLAPPLPANLLNVPRNEMGPLIARSFLPPVFLITLIKGSILLGWATPSEAGRGRSLWVQTLLAAFNRRLSRETLVGVCHTSAKTVSMIFFIVISATCFAYVYRSLGGDDVVEHLIVEKAGLDAWGNAVPDHGNRVLPRVLPRLAGDHPDRAAGIHAAGGRAGLRRSPAAGGHQVLVHHPAGREPANVIPHATLRVRAVLHEGIAPREIKIESIYKGIIPFVFPAGTGASSPSWRIRRSHCG